MEMIKIPHTDLEVSRLAMGCMGLGGGWGSGTQLTADHERQAREFLDAAEEIGANFFDHANIYGRGRSEEVFGRVLKERPSLRDKIMIQSKCGIRWADDPPGTPLRYDFSREHILESVDAILWRLGTDRLDILLLHRPDPLWEGEEIAEAFRKLHLSGKVRYFGVSNQNRFQMEYLQSFLQEALVANQMEMNLLHHGFVEVGISFNQSSPRYPDGWEGTMEYCRLKGVLLQAWSPLDLLPISGQVVSLVFGGLKGVFVVGYWLHSSPRKCSRSQVSKATMRSRGVIVGSPRIELYFSIFDRPEQLQVQAFVAQARIEALNEAVLHRLSWPNVVNPDSV